MKYIEVATREDVAALFANYPTVIVEAEIADKDQDRKKGAVQWHSGTVLKHINVRGVSDYTSERVEVEITADMVKYISTLPDVRLCETSPGSSFSHHKFYCLNSLYMLNSITVNRGFPYSMTYKDLRIGAVVLTTWRDSEPLTGIIIDVDEHAHNYKGERSFKIVCVDGTVQRCVHTQIIQMLDVNGMQTLHDAIQKPKPSYESALLHIQQIAQGHTDPAMREISETADSALTDTNVPETITKSQLIQAVQTLRGDRNTEYNRALAEVCAWLMPECNREDIDDPIELLDSLQ